MVDIDTIESLQQHQLVILRRLRNGPLTEFELATEVADHSGHSYEEASDKMADWLDELRTAGMVWFGTLSNSAFAIAPIISATAAMASQFIYPPNGELSGSSVKLATSALGH